MTSLNVTTCNVRRVRCCLDDHSCRHCGQPARQVGEAARTAIDFDLDHPVVLWVTVSVHHCSRCRQYFRSQPPFLRPDAVYTNRVVNKAVASVYEDGMAMRRAVDRSTGGLADKIHL